MRIGILSRQPALYSTQRLRKAALRRGHNVRIINYLRCWMGIVGSRPAVNYGGEQLDLDVVIPRVGASSTLYGSAVVRQFEVMGVTVSTGSQALLRARDKLRAMQILSRSGLELPATGFAHSTKDIAGLIEMVGGPPLIIKMLSGTQGIGVVLAETHKAAESVIAAFRQLNADILVQEFVSEVEGEDIRCFVVGDRVVAAMKRKAPPGEFRANLHRGGSAETVELTDAERESAVRATHALGMRIAGVDLLRASRGPLILEVNSSPGLEGVEKATGIDVGGEIIAYLERIVRDGASADQVSV